MKSHTKARIVAAIALPLLILAGTPARAQVANPVPATIAAPERLAHISVVSAGEGPPVILIPGLSSPRAVWFGVAPMLAAHHRVLIVQVNGFGGDDPGENLRPGMLAGVVADLHGYLASHHVQRAAVIGHSMGGLAALMLAKAHPDDVTKLMVVDALPFVGEIFVPGATVAMLAPQAAALHDGMARGYGKPADPAANAAIAAGQALTPAAREQVAVWIAKADPRVSGQALSEDMSTDLRPDMARITAPITVLYPWSTRLPKARAEALYRGAYAKAPQVGYVDVGDSGHFVMLDQPTAFAAAVDRFLAE